MNKSVMKCCICNNENIGQFITINNKKYHLCCIEQLQQENQQLQERIDKAIEFSNKNWGTWCTHHIEYMTELQNILKEEP